VHWYDGDWEIGNPVDKKSLQFGIVKPEIATRREVPFKGPAVRISKNQDSRDR
jgi:hypothetical protein